MEARMMVAIMIIKTFFRKKITTYNLKLYVDQNKHKKMYN